MKGGLNDGELESWYASRGWILRPADWYILETKGGGVMDRARGSGLASFSGNPVLH